MSEEIKSPEAVDQFELNPEELENTIASMDSATIDEFDSSKMDFEKFIVLAKKDLQNFCRMVEPLTKASVDDYGKCVFVTCIDETKVELCYYNNPYRITSIIENRSKKTTKSFAVTVSTLKRVATSAFASLIIVEENGEMNLALCEQLLYLETKPLKADFYQFEKKEAVNIIDKELAHHTFRKMGSVLSLTDRASEKLIVIKNNQANFNTGVFTSRSKSPFGESDDFVIYKQVSDVIGVLSEISKQSLTWNLYPVEGKNNESRIVVKCDDVIYCEMPAASGNKVSEYLSPTADLILRFDAPISIINDNLVRLIGIVKSLEYLNNIVTLGFKKDKMFLTVATSNNSKSSTYEFIIVEGAPEIEGEMKLGVDVLLIFLQIVGTDVKYAFNDNGLGIRNEIGSFLIRRS